MSNNRGKLNKKLSDLKQVEKDLEWAWNFFNNVTEPDYIDEAIKLINKFEKKYELLLTEISIKPKINE